MLGVIALLAAAAAAGWILVRAGKGGGVGGEKRSMLILRGAVWFALVAALFAAKLFPLAFMATLAAIGVSAIEFWRARAIKASDAMTPGAGAGPPRSNALSSLEEAAALLGVSLDASADDIRAAHRRLIAQLHPDKGGTDYLAAKINEARDLMLSAPRPPAA
jgi:hypothetical protein